MESTLLVLQGISNLVKRMSGIDRETIKDLAAELTLYTLILRKWTRNDIYNRQKLVSGYLEHNDHVRAIVPKGNLLEFRAEQGWKPLCEFLGKEVPEEPYPRINEGSNVADIHTKIFWLYTAKLAAMAAVVPVAVAILAWGLRQGEWSTPWNL